MMSEEQLDAYTELEIMRHTFLKAQKCVLSPDVTVTMVRSAAPLSAFEPYDAWARGYLDPKELVVPRDSSLYQFPEITIPSGSIDDVDMDDELPSINLTKILDPSSILDGSESTITAPKMETEKYLVREYESRDDVRPIRRRDSSHA